jgi:Family of unknown function (DUF5670)
MLYTLAAILFVLWLTGPLTSYAMGGYIDILLWIAVLVALLRIIRGPHVVATKN